MYSSIRLAKKYLRYYFTAHNGRGHGMHSPFVFQFILEVLNNRSGRTPPADIEALRKALLRDSRILQIEDFGAGSRSTSGKERSVNEVAASALKPKKYAHLLYRLVKNYQPKIVLELGTSLGLTTAYLAAANPAATIITIEGSKSIAAIAAENFSRLRLQNIHQQLGNFDELLPTVITQFTSLDLAYIDGNHRVLFYLRNHVSDLINDFPSMAFPTAPLFSVNRAQLSPFVGPFIPNAYTRFFE